MFIFVFTVLLIYFSAVLHLLSWKHERWATSKLELHHMQWGNMETFEPPQGNRNSMISKPLLPPNICPSAWGKAADQRRYCSIQPRSWHRSPRAVWKPRQGMPALGVTQEAAWGFQPALVSQTPRWSSEGCSSIEETSPHPWVLILTGIDSTR